MTLIWGHRGAREYAPENTLPSFELALEQGAEGIELDVHLSADGEAVVIHDETVDRTTNGSGLVSEHTVAQLRALDASMGRDGFAGAWVPTLREVLELAVARKTYVNIELKTDEVAYPGLVERVMTVVAETGADVIYSSFNHDTLRELHAAGTTAPLAALLYGKHGDPFASVAAVAADVPLAAVHPPYQGVTAEALAKVAELGAFDVNVWTVNDVDEMRRLLGFGVHAIITDVPAVALAVRDEFAG